MSVVEIDLASVNWSDWREDPYPLYDVLRERSPVYRDERNDMYILTRYADIDATLVDHRRFSNIPTYVIEGGVEPVSPLREEDAPRHTFLRRIVMPMFTPREMRSLEPYFRALAGELLDAAERSPVVEISSALAVPLPGRVTCDLLGLPVEHHRRFHELTEERLAYAAVQSGRNAAAEVRSIDEIRAEQWQIVEPIVHARRREPAHDAISLLVAAQDAAGREAVSDELIVDMLLHLLTGGFHTTQHLIEMLIDLLVDRPELWSALEQDRSLIPVAIDEMLRLDAPVQALRRRALESVVIADTEIPAGATVAVVYGAGNRDPRVFEDPDSFLLDRGPTRHMAFSAGIHYCPGAPVSRFEVRELIDVMLDRYASIERAGPTVRRFPSPNAHTVEAMRGLASVPVRFNPRAG